MGRGPYAGDSASPFRKTLQVKIVDDEEYEDVEQEAGFELEMESEFFEDY